MDVPEYGLDELLAQVKREQLQLDALRADHRVITSSRLYGAQLAASSLQRLFSRRRPAAEPHSVIPAGRNDDPGFEPASFERLCASWNRRMETRPLSAEPVVTVVIPAFNHAGATIRCLQSIADTWFDSLPVQIVLADDGSTDETTTLGAALVGLNVVRAEKNRGFIAACNGGAQAARGRYICFLNNDTEVRNAWLDWLVATAENDGTVGIVGAKLVYPNGRLQEAGGIIYRDGDGANYGRGGDPADPRYNYVRDVDYCSGAALLVRTDVFRRLGGFDSKYAPAYYEDTDLCFAARAEGYRVVYQPRSEVVHYEGVSSGTDLSSGVKRYQNVNRSKFSEKWRDALARHVDNGSQVQPLAARRIRRGETILVIDSYVPLHDRESGSKRLFGILRILREVGYHVMFLPDNYAALQPYTSELQAMGIEVIYHVQGGRSIEEAIQEVLPILDFAWICRPELFQKYHTAFRANGATRLIYDTIDLHFVRERRKHEMLGTSDGRNWEKTRDIELSCTRKADATITVTEVERDVLEGLGARNVHVIPNLHDCELAVATSLSERNGILFIGGYNHPPNVDAAEWLCHEIMPLVREHLPDVVLTLAGSDPPPAVRVLAGKFVNVPGYVPNVGPFFETNRLFVAPLRFGAGLKGKVGQSLSFGLPIVMTQIAAEGFEIEDGRHYLEASTPKEFADAIIRLYRDRELWQRLSENSREAVAPFSSHRVSPRIVSLLRGLRDVPSVA